MQSLLLPAAIHPQRGCTKLLWPFALNKDSDQADGLVAWYPFWSANDDARDMGPTNLPLTNTASILWTAQEQMGYVPDMNGTTQYFVSTTALLTTTPLTITAWGRSTQNTASRPLAGVFRNDADASAYYVQWSGARTGDPISAVTYTSSNTFVIADSATGFSTNTWHHGSAIIASSTSRIAAIDGILGTTETTSGVTTLINSTCIGRLNRLTPANYFQGQAGDVRFYNRALTAAEIYAHYEPSTRWELYYPLRQKTWSLRCLRRRQRGSGRSLPSDRPPRWPATSGRSPRYEHRTRSCRRQTGSNCSTIAGTTRLQIKLVFARRGRRSRHGNPGYPQRAHYSGVAR